MTRTTQSVSTRTVSKATHQGWELTFTHEVSGDQETVFCNGTNGTGGNINATRNGANGGVNFSGWKYDAALSGDILEEMEAILA